MSEAPLLLFLCMNEWSMKGLLPCLYSLLRSVWGGYFLEPRMPQPLHVTRAPPFEGVVERSQGRCAHTQGASTPWSVRLATAFAWWIPGWAQAAPWVLSCPGYLSRWAFWLFLYTIQHYALSECAFLVYFIVFVFKSCKSRNLQIHVEFG